MTEALQPVVIQVRIVGGTVYDMITGQEDAPEDSVETEDSK